MQVVLAEVKHSLGRDAVILSTRVIERRAWLGLKRRSMVEVTAGTGAHVRPRATRGMPTSHAPAPTRVSQAMTGNDCGCSSGAAALLQTPAAGNALLLAVTREMESLKGMVKDLVGHVRQQQSPQVPENLFDHYLELIEKQLADEVALEIVQAVGRNHRPELLGSKDFVRERMLEQIEKLVPVAGPIVRRRTDGPHTVALIGPTGVGKTTTIAKLAANLKLCEKRRVGLITIDTYRIGATDQLRKYADILRAPLRVVGTPEEMAGTIASMHDYDFVLIDTAGRSPNDQLKLGELKTFIDRARPDEVHLVLSSTCARHCMELAIERFGDVRVDKVIFTKLDEAVELGVVLNVIRKLNKALSYITTGQDVPNDIEVGHGRALARRILGVQS